MVTLAAQAESDFLGFMLDSDEFAETVTYAPLAGGSSTPLVLPKRLDSGRDFTGDGLGYGDGRKTAVLRAVFLVSTDATGGVAAPVIGDTVTWDSVAYTVDSIERNTGMSTLIAVAIDASMCKYTVTIEKATHTEDDYGTSTVAWSDHSTVVKMDIQAVMVEDVPVAGAEKYDVSHLGFVSYGQSVTGEPVTDLIDFVRGDADSTQLRIKLVDDTMTRYFIVKGAYDIAEQKRMIRVEMKEVEEHWADG